MSRNISTTARAALFSAETDKVFLPLLTITSGATVLRYCRNSQNVTSNGQVFEAYPFNLALPDDEDSGTVQSVRLVIDNVDRRLTPILRQISEAPEVSLQIVVASQPDIVEVGPLSFRLQEVTYDAQAVSGTLIYEDRLQTQVPGLDFGPSDFPGLF